MKPNLLGQLRGTMSQKRAPWIVAFAAMAFCCGQALAGGARVFTTFLQENAMPVGIGHDAAGNIFLVSTGLTAGSFSATQLNPNATEVIYSVNLPGSDDCLPRAMSVDPQGNLYITGYCDGGTFPVTSGFSGPIPSAASYAFAIKLNPDSTVGYAVLFAGAVFAVPEGIAVDASG